MDIKDIENRLRDYFNYDRRVNNLNKKIDLLKSQISEIDYKLGHVDYDIPEESLGISYDEKVQTNRQECGYAEKAAIKITDRLEEEKTWKQQEIADTEEGLRDMEFNNILVEGWLDELNEDDAKFIEEKYNSREKIADWKVGMKYGVSQAAVTCRKNKILKKILKRCG